MYSTVLWRNNSFSLNGFGRFDWIERSICGRRRGLLSERQRICQVASHAATGRVYFGGGSPDPSLERRTMDASERQGNDKDTSGLKVAYKSHIQGIQGIANILRE